MRVDFTLSLLPPGIFLATTAVALWQSATFPKAAGGVPGPALVPMILAVVLGLASLALVTGALQRRNLSGKSENLKSRPEDTAKASVPWRRLGMLLAAIVLYLVVMPWMGFISSTTVFIAVSLFCFDYRKGIHNWAFAILAAYILYALFALLMNVPLPVGWLG